MNYFFVLHARKSCVSHRRKKTNQVLKEMWAYKRFSFSFLSELFLWFEGRVKCKEQVEPADTVNQEQDCKHIQTHTYSNSTNKKSSPWASLKRYWRMRRENKQRFIWKSQTPLLTSRQLKSHNPFMCKDLPSFMSPLCRALYRHLLDSQFNLKYLSRDSFLSETD